MQYIMVIHFFNLKALESYKKARGADMVNEKRPLFLTATLKDKKFIWYFFNFFFFFIG